MLEEVLEISLHALTGWTLHKTMRIKAHILGRELIILVDSGPTHNFIRRKVAELPRLPYTPMDAFNVKVENGKPLKCEGRFDDVAVNVQDAKFKVTFFELPLVGIDVVLGVQWLEELGIIVYHWKTLAMMFLC